MLNPLQKFNSKIFNADVELVSTRTGFGEGLVLAGEADKNVVGLCADLTESVQMHFFKSDITIFIRSDSPAKIQRPVGLR